MSIINHNLLRTAGLIQVELVAHSHLYPALNLPKLHWERVERIARSVELARGRDWQAAARQREEELLRAVDELENALTRLTDQVRLRQAPQTIPTPAELYRDLVALESEFEALQCEPEGQTISVTTEPIVLEQIYLGPFQIRLSWQHRSQETWCYTIVALEPHPAQCNDCVTHPHVTDETLCEGDGRRAIRSALAAGRLFDFFTIVGQLLLTYAPGRAYVELDQWNGLPCHDCGSTVSDDDRYCCARCEETLCCDCGTCCGQCDQVQCSNCSSNCQLCDRPICNSCLERCRSCGSLVCCDCSSNNLCSQCHETPTEEEETHDLEINNSPESQPAVHALGLGQTAVPT